jgi:uncharacterized membrane protein
LEEPNLANRILSLVLIAALLGTIGILIYLVVTPKAGDSFTEFYITDLEGETTGYPCELSEGEKGKVIAVIANHENKEASYWIEVRIDGIKNNEVGPVVLGNEQKWEEIISFTVDRAGDNRKVEFLLYKNNVSEPYLKPLQLWVNVK